MRDLFGLIAEFTDIRTGFKGQFRITTSKPNPDGWIFGVMVSGGTVESMYGRGEWVRMSELSHFRKSIVENGLYGIVPVDIHAVA